MSAVNEVEEFQFGDIVYRFDKRKKIVFGVVVDIYNNEFADDSDDSIELQEDQIEVRWNNSYRESVWKQNKVGFCTFLENGTETKMGYCKEVKQFATVQIVGTDKIIERVSSQRLNDVSQFGNYVIVYLDNKYGEIRGINNKIKMQSTCGSTVEVFSSINHDVQDFWLSKRNRKYFGILYPGQEVICTPNNLEQPQWLKRSKTMKRSMKTRQRFTVQKVEPLDIEVCWYDSMSQFMFGKRLGHIKTEDVPRLQIVKPRFSSLLELDQRCLLKLNFSDVLLTKKDWIRKQSVVHQPEHHNVLHIVNRTSKKNRRPKLRRPSLLATCVNINESEEGWYTEEEEEEVSNNGSSSTTSNTRLNARHFPPKLRELVPGNTVAVEVLCTDSKVTIVWQDGTEEKDIPSTLLNSSISPDDHEFFPGNWVISDGKTEMYGAVQHVNHLEQTATVKWFTHKKGNEKPQLVSTNEMSVYDLRKHPKYAFRPGSLVFPYPQQIPIKKFGTVLDNCPEGYVIVEWVNGVQENCRPQNIKLMIDSITDYEESVIKGTVTRVGNILVKLLTMMKVGMDLAYAEIISRIGWPQILTVITKPSNPAYNAGNSFCLLNPLKLNKSVISSENEVFTILDEAHISHHFYSRKFQPMNKQKFFKIVQKEFKLLKESLPPGVWVRSYGNRMDLLSVMIAGPKETPYEDGLFLFDLQLSQDFPLSPPLCHYISYSSERLNPNLYVEGKVCVSLLGTWSGRSTEVWSTNCTLLQLIVSIQGLILVAEPYYNEPGYEKQMDSQQGYENSKRYNELVILNLVKSMTELALAPYEVFAKEIGTYCVTHGEGMCNRLERWCDDSEPLKLEFPLLPVSKGLKLSLTFALKSFKDVLKKTNFPSNAQSVSL
ncbi:hypothetical protein RI129_007288 [Pyrocoelia pectoralis]|uniref:UBC core domain-containing protein n=1 Tax=Pyrocoelia pectoralis TaxID=417401 RepID=A0AAN7VDS9_9COLE